MEATAEAGSLSCTRVAQPMQRDPIVQEAGKSQHVMIQWYDIVGYQRACMVGVNCSMASNTSSDGRWSVDYAW